MKIGYFTATDITISETFIYKLIRGLEQRTEQEAPGELIHFTGSKRGKKVAKNTQFSHFRLNNRLIKTIYEIEERFKLKTDLTARIKHAWVNKKLRKLTKHNSIDVAYVDYGQTSILLYKFFIKNNIPFVVHFHGYDANKAFNSVLYAREIEKVFQSASSIIVASYFLKRLLILKGCPADKIEIVRYGIEVDKMKPIPWPEKIKKEPSVVFLGRLTEKKNPVALLHAFHIVKEQIPAAKLTIIGDGQLKSAVKQHINLLNLEGAVYLLGSLSQDDAHQELKRHWDLCPTQCHRNRW